MASSPRNCCSRLPPLTISTWKRRKGMYTSATERSGPKIKLRAESRRPPGENCSVASSRVTFGFKVRIRGIGIVQNRSIIEKTSVSCSVVLEGAEQQRTARIARLLTCRLFQDDLCCNHLEAPAAPAEIARLFILSLGKLMIL